MGQRIHTTELLESPLEAGNHRWIKKFLHLYIGTLNHYDLIISKLFRGSQVDFQDCLALLKAKRQEINTTTLEERYKETVRYDVSEKRILETWEHFKQRMKNEALL